MDEKTFNIIFSSPKLISSLGDKLEDFRTALVKFGTSYQISRYIYWNYDSWRVIRETFMTKDHIFLREILDTVPYDRLFCYWQRGEDDAYILIFAMQRRLIFFPEYILLEVQGNIDQQMTVINSVLGMPHYRGIIRDYLTLSDDDAKTVLQADNYKYASIYWNIVDGRLCKKDEYDEIEDLIPMPI